MSTAQVPGLLDNHLSYYSIPAAWFICFLPKLYGLQLYNKSIAGKKFDGHNPWQTIAELQNDKSVDATTRGYILRADAAQMNGFENVGFYAAAVVAANAAGLDNRKLNLLCALYLVSRVAYGVVYVQGRSRWPFFGCAGTIFALFTMAENAIRAGSR